MSKIGSAFGGGGSTKPTKREIFEGLFKAKQEKDALALLGLPGGTPNASLEKFNRNRLKKASRLKGGRVGVSSEEENDNTIKRPGARTAKLLGS